jgi:hypothetical protein
VLDSVTVMQVKPERELASELPVISPSRLLRICPRHVLISIPFSSRTERALPSDVWYPADSRAECLFAVLVYAMNYVGAPNQAVAASSNEDMASGH